MGLCISYSELYIIVYIGNINILILKFWKVNFIVMCSLLVKIGFVNFIIMFEGVGNELSIFKFYGVVLLV